MVMRALLVTNSIYTYNRYKQTVAEGMSLSVDDVTQLCLGTLILRKYDVQTKEDEMGWLHRIARRYMPEN
jgi:DNA-directed RNA polymerase specialized sigma24 family protein